ncbi:MAG: Gfo/Idh/MocA family oxidoreductase [Oscillospiraceae bacterium]
MKILFMGLGSIGSRHIKNLDTVLCERGISHRIDAVRSSDKQLRGGVQALLTNSYYSVDEIKEKYDVAFITNPSSLHESSVKSLVDIAENMFIEKPVFSRNDIDEHALGLHADGVYYVACPLRHTPVIRRMKRICEQNHVVSARAISSSYLPDWRPETDYRACYSARRELGGGVVLDLIHEWDYLSYLFGIPSSVFGFSGKYSELEINSDDVAVYIARYNDLLLSLHLDYVGRKSVREIEIYCNNETYCGDILNRTVTHRASGEVETFEPEDFYLNEMNYFIDCVLDKTANNMNTVTNALMVLKTAEIKS